MRDQSKTTMFFGTGTGSTTGTVIHDLMMMVMKAMMRSRRAGGGLID